MKYFSYLSEEDREGLFFREPQPFTRLSDREMLRHAVGGLLYIPASSPNIAQIICNGKIQSLVSMAVCLEDSVGDENREACLKNVERQFEELARALENGDLTEDTLPLLFIRVKDVQMLARIAEFLIRRSRLLTGVILPKVTRADLPQYLALIEDINRRTLAPLYAMPILESEELMTSTERPALLEELRQITDRYQEQVLGVRIGATDFCGLYGIRRAPDTPIYSVGVTAACIADIVRVFGLHDRYTISGPVWEYFSSPARMRATGKQAEMEGLLRETALDLQNGLLGKTCVHPSQLPAVQASYAASYEEYEDAMGVLFGDRERDGVQSSMMHNKMNELRPHRLWARKIVSRAEIYGVYRENTGRVGMLRALYSKEYLT